LLINGVGDAFSPPRRMRVKDGTQLGLMLILRDATADELCQPFGEDASPMVRVR
jgi:hypothetical protein